MQHDIEYLNLVKNILDNGVQKGDRTGTGTLSLFAQQMRFDLSNNSIPLLTTKKMFTRGIIHEILWYLRGDTNIKYLVDNNVHMWDEWADEDGELGPLSVALECLAQPGPHGRANPRTSASASPAEKKSCPDGSYETG